MYCRNCGNKLDESSNFCTSCGEKVEREILENAKIEDQETNGVEVLPENTKIEDHSKKNNIARKVFKGLGVGGAVIGGGILYLIFTVLRFLYIAAAGLSAVFFSINLFQDSNIVWGLVVLLLGTPLAIWIASYLFLPLLFISILTLIIWGAAILFGFDVSFGDTWSIIWFLIGIVILGYLAFVGVKKFIIATKEKYIPGFFKEYWLGILFFLFFFWLVFF